MSGQHQLPGVKSIWKKKVSIKKTNGDGVYVSFMFVATDSKNDIHEEISKCFGIQCFSIRDSEGNYITGSYDSLETDARYDIIDRDDTDDTDEGVIIEGGAKRKRKPPQSPRIGTGKKSKQTLPRACSRCREVKKKCDRQKPCERCRKSNWPNCDVGKTDTKG